MISCQEKNIDNIKKLIQNQVTFLQHYEYLHSLYTLDYFVHNHWNQIPLLWQNILENFKMEDLGNFLDSKQLFKFHKVLPLSLLAFRATAKVLSLPRHIKNPVNDLEKFVYEVYGLPQTNAEKFLCSDLSQTHLSEHANQKSSQHKDLPEYCRRHVKLKKQHEICHLSQIINFLLKKFNINHVIDIGSGLGHLSRLLCLKYNLNVATVEANDTYVSAASILDRKAFSCFKKTHTTDAPVSSTELDVKDLPHHQKIAISHQSCHSSLHKIMKEAWIGQKDTGENLHPFGLLGLHTCGDLAVILLRLFVETTNAHGLLSLGCCYMKLTTDGSTRGFPLSNFVSDFNIDLSTEAREISCHAMEKYVERLKENSESLKIHCCRAVLEKLIVKYYPNEKHLGLRSVKHAEKLNFHEYAMKALKHTSLQFPSHEINLFGETYLKEWKKVVIIYSLRLLTAPVIESFLLLDRMIFLYEHGLKSCIIPIFDPLISPRNHLLFSWKPH